MLVFVIGDNGNKVSPRNFHHEFGKWFPKEKRSGLDFNPYPI
jgi:hypothetical protein